METRILRCKLTDKQLDERRDALAELVSKHAAAEEAKKEAAATAKKEIDRIKAEMSQIAYEIRQRAEQR